MLNNNMSSNNNLVAVIGAGAMGRGIAEAIISSGSRVILFNRSEKD